MTDSPIIEAINITHTNNTTHSNNTASTNTHTRTHTHTHAGMIGEVYVIRHDVNLHSEILGTYSTVQYTK